MCGDWHCLLWWGRAQFSFCGWLFCLLIAADLVETEQSSATVGLKLHSHSYHTLKLRTSFRLAFWLLFGFCLDLGIRLFLKDWVRCTFYLLTRPCQRTGTKLSRLLELHNTWPEEEEAFPEEKFRASYEQKENKSLPQDWTSALCIPSKGTSPAIVGLQSHRLYKEICYPKRED